ncbi:MAG: alginate export family protein, partial [Elusimicrobia bacterium]|nr:alginate export family protein [Elusimicrobiota bacterium]
MIVLTSLFLIVAASSSAVEPPKLSFGGQIRARAETTNVESYATPLKRRGYDLTTLRTRLGVGVDAGQGVKGFLQLQDSRNWGSEASVAANSANVDLHQGYVDVLDLFAQPLDLRAGRQELSYGDQRLISPLDWSNVGRAWDGARLRWRGSNYTVDLFETVVKDVNVAKRDGHFWGLYAFCKAAAKHEFDAYVLGRDQRDGTFLNEHGTLGNLSDRTLGARVKGTPGRFDYTGEADWQFGRRAGQRVRAWALAATGGYTLEHSLKPRLGVEYDFASGDANPSDNKAQTFDPLYPFGHSYQGYQDLFSWKNGHDFKGSVSVDPKPGW